MAFRFLSETLTRLISHVSAAAISSGGTGHAVDDIITMTLGTGGVGTACQIRVTSVSGGVIDGISVESSGAYTTVPAPTTGIAQASTTGSGTGFTADLTFELERGYIQSAKSILDWLTHGKITGVAIVAGGTGYAVDDVVELNAGTALLTARFQVTSVNAGVVDGLQMVSSGSYTVLPDDSAASHPTTGGTGTGLTVDITPEGNYRATPVAAGASYAVGDTVTITGGTLHAGETAATFVVTAETGGAVDSLAPLNVARYDALPANPAATTTSGSGTGLTVNLAQVSWVHSGAASEDYTDGITDFSWWATGVNNAGGDPVCGMITELSGSDRWLRLKVATAFDPGQSFNFQPNASPDTCRLASADQAITLFVNTNDARSMNIVSRVSPTYEHGYMGCFTPFIDSPSTKYPFPLICAGSTISANINSPFAGRDLNNEGAKHASILHHGESGAGPYYIRDLVGTWRNFESAGIDSDFRLWPFNSEWQPGSDFDAPNIQTGSGTVTPPAPQSTALLDATRDYFVTGLFNDNVALNPTPFGPGGQNLYFFVAPIIVEEFQTTHQIYGELEGVYAMNGRGLASEDRTQDPSGASYFVFTDSLSNENRNFIALREGD